MINISDVKKYKSKKYIISSSKDNYLKEAEFAT